MPTESTTKSQVQAFRFGVRRLEVAVSTGRSYRPTLGGPRSGLAVLLGFALATLLAAGFAVYGLIKPAPSIAGAKVLIDSDSGGAYVVRDGRIYPATNLTSALLAAAAGGSSSSSGPPRRKSVNAASLARLPKGQLIGIAGAPNQLPASSKLVPATWAVCDVSTADPSTADTRPPQLRTTAILGETAPPGPPDGEATLVSPDDGRSTYLLWRGARARVDPGDRAVAVALGLDGLTARPVSLALLDAIPEAAAFTEPSVPGAGSSVAWSDRVSVGSMVSVPAANAVEHYLVLSDGVERVNPLVSDVIRAAQPAGTAEITMSLPDLDRAPVSRHPVDLSDYPPAAPTFLAAVDRPVICVSWTGTPASGARGYAVYATTALPMPRAASAVPAPPGRAPGTVDAVYLAAGHGAVIGQVTGDQPCASGAKFLVTDQGIKYPVVSDQALGYLGLNKTCNPASPGLLSLLPTGPTLDPTRAAEFYTGSH